MLFWCPPILLAASQSYLPESDNFTSLIRSDELPCCPLTSIRPSGLCLHRFRKKKDFTLVLYEMMTKHRVFITYIINENSLTCITFFLKAMFLYLWLTVFGFSILPAHLLTGTLTCSENFNTCFINLFYLVHSVLFKKLACSSRKRFVGFQLCSLQTQQNNNAYSILAETHQKMVFLLDFSFLFHHVKTMYQDVWKLKALRRIYSYFWMNETALLISLFSTLPINR